MEQYSPVIAGLASASPDGSASERISSLSFLAFRCWECKMFSNTFLHPRVGLQWCDSLFKKKEKKERIYATPRW